MKPLAPTISLRAALISFLAALACAVPLLIPLQDAFAKDLSDQSGVMRSDVIAQLSRHEYDTFYLGTVYHGGKWMSPNGDTSYNGVAGMNCTGFVAYVMTHAGLSEAAFLDSIRSDWRYDDWGLCAASNWMLYAEKSGLDTLWFSSKADLLASGKAEKGDVLLMWKGYVHELGYGEDNHIGFFWGNTSSKDWLWHSTEPCNQMSLITPKSWDCSYVLIKLHNNGYIDLKKASAIPSISADNANYSLQSAVYGIYSNAACTSEVARLTTDASGYAKSGQLKTGAYYVKEISAPKGYQRDAKVYQATVASDQTTRVNGESVGDTPQSNPVDLLVGKIDAESTREAAQGGASFKGAQFQVDFYTGYFSTSDTSWINTETPARSWVFETDDSGQAYFSDGYFVSGDALYRASNGKATLPLGTVAIRETKAPEGYFCDSGVHVRQITAGDQAVEHLTCFTKAVASEQVYRGGLSLMKFTEDSLKDEERPEQKKPSAGVIFTIYNDNDLAVMRADGTLAEKGEVVASITTDDEGYAATKPQELPYGSYVVEEDPATTPDGYMPIESFRATVSADAKTYRFILEDKLINSPVKIKKIDAETKLQIPAQVGYRLFDKDKNPIVFTTHYPETEVHDVFTAAADGTLSFPEPLLAGSYFLREAQAPEGYVLSDEYLPFTISEDANWDCPVEIEFENTPVKGEIAIVKSDELTGEAVAGAEYSIRAATDIITPDGTLRVAADELVASGLVTDGEGKASVAGLYLGTYKIYETKAPAGYALDTEEHLVAVASQGQDVPVVTMRAALTDRPTAVQILKTDGETKAPLAGATYRIWQAGADASSVFAFGEIEGAVTEFIEGSLGDDAESVSLNEPAATRAAFSGAAAGQTVDFGFTVKHRDGSYQEYRYRASFNDDASIDINHEKGNLLAKLDPAQTSDPDAFDFTGETDEEGRIFLPYLTRGTYLLAEIAAPTGYSLAGNDATISFEVDDQGLINGRATFEVQQDNFKIAINTSATDGESGTQVAPCNAEAIIVDKVMFENLTVGKEYTLVGTLMDKATGEPLVINGEQIEAQTHAFTPELKDGFTLVNFKIDAREMANRDVVVFESLYLDGEEVLVHADLDNQDQTVGFADNAEIKTKAAEKGTGAKSITAKSNVSVVDTVTFKGLTSGKEYLLKGMLMDRSSGKALTVNNTEVVSELRFTPQSSEGTAAVEFTFNASKLAGHELVAFEALYDAEGSLVAEHQDINDGGQTVAIVAPGTPYDKTGSSIAADVSHHAWAIPLAGIAALLSSAYGIRQLKKASRHKKILELGKTRAMR